MLVGERHHGTAKEVWSQAAIPRSQVQGLPPILSLRKTMLLNTVIFVWSLLNTVIRGYVVKSFWTWFLIPLFPDVPQLEILPAIGLIYLVGLFVPVKSVTTDDLKRTREETESEKKTVAMVNAAGYTVAMAFTWGTGWLIHYFM